MGIYVDRGVINLDNTLADLKINDKGGLTLLERKATVRQLLQARSGIYHPAAYETAGMKARRPARGSHAPGEFWYYNNWDFNALGTIFHQLTGKTVFESLHDDLAKPLQFEDFNPAADTKFQYEDSSDHPAYVMRLSARDLARVGTLMSHAGKWNDRRIVSKTWIDESTTSYSSAGSGVGYGYLWWVGVDHWHFRSKFPGQVYSARGNRGQYLLIDPTRDLVIVHRVNSENDSQREVTSQQFGDLLKRILDAKSAD